jgi:dolichyl-phosphate-mannose-protein mannosyltransferase
MTAFTAAGVTLYSIGAVRDKLCTRIDAVALFLLVVCAAVMAFAGLGSRHAPHSYWSTAGEGEAAVADAGTVVEVDRISHWVGLGKGACAIELSRDGASWKRVGSIEQPGIFGYVEWRALSVSAAARYLRLVALRPGLEIGEVGAFGPDGRQLQLAGIEGPTEAFDEQAIVVRIPTAQTGMYFDETYFARSAWEQLRGIEPTETSQPPLGRTIISLGIGLWGMNPFGWRFMGALAGTLSVAVLYLLARRLFGRTSWAFFAGLLFMVDFLRFAQSRMATVDVFVLLFTLLAFWFALEHERGTHPWPWLLAAGAALGAGLACKWSAAYPAIGVVVLFAGAEIRRAREAPGREAVVAIASAVCRGLVCLAAVPIAVYAASWLPWMVGRGTTVAEVVARHVAMYRYHSTISETRWYASAWWKWPLDLRPIWLYRGTVDVAADRVASIVTMGNPAIWWSGTLATPAVAAIALARRDRAAAWILAALLCSWLPWAFAARRLTFIYHFLPATPFLVLGLVRCFERLADRFPRTRPAAIAFASVTVLVFALFLPLLTGMPVPRGYAEALRWLNTWIFFA